MKEGGIGAWERLISTLSGGHVELVPRICELLREHGAAIGHGLRWLIEGDPDVDRVEVYRNAELIRGYDPVREGEKAGTLTLHGWVYHLATGEFEAYDATPGRQSSVPCG